MFDELRAEGSLEKGKLAFRTRITSSFQITGDSRVLYDDPEFPIYEFCEQLTGFLRSNSDHFEFVSLATHENPWLIFQREGGDVTVWARYPVSNPDSVTVGTKSFFSDSEDLLETFRMALQSEFGIEFEPY